MSQISYSRYKYNPNEINEKDFLSKFVVRTDIFDEIFDDIKNSDYNIQNQHYILIGQRGQGKTTLLRKIELEIRRDKELSKFLLPVKFAEEQYQIRSLCRLWEEVADYLQSIYEDEFPDVLDKMEKHFDDEDYDLKCFSYLEKALKEKNKKLILLIDNIDELLGKLKEKGQRQLREIMLESTSFRIVGGSTKMIEQHYDYGKPFYEFFNIVKLTGLNQEDSIEFLKTVGNDEQKKIIESILKTSPRRVETLRRLTGGVPRTLIMLLDVFIDDKGDAFEDLVQILDEATPLYKDRMDELPETLQDIVHTIAMNWDGMLTKEIAKKTRMESKEVSAQLKRLEKFQIVEFETTGKNKIYKIQERFFNIWYLMRFGRKKDRQRVEWLVKLLVSWCTPKELKQRAEKFLQQIRYGKLDEKYAYYMSEALRYTGLDSDIEDTIKQETFSYLSSLNSNFVKELSLSDKEIYENFVNYLSKKNYKLAIKELKRIKKQSEEISNTLQIIQHLEDINKTTNEIEKTLSQKINKLDSNELSLLASLYFTKNKKRETAMQIMEQAINQEKNLSSLFVSAIIFLWNENFSKSYKIFLEWLQYKDFLNNEESIPQYITLLMSKGQLYKAKEFLEIEEYNLKEHYKPLWYALMKLVEDNFPHEIKKMGSELQESVNEILEDVEISKKKYKI
ncbi:MAG: ATP-binding protein [Campylobacterales bacterium]|nr:ATP-binding protein [Campylobacterales bacterium]